MHHRGFELMTRLCVGHGRKDCAFIWRGVLEWLKVLFVLDTTWRHRLTLNDVHCPNALQWRWCLCAYVHWPWRCMCGTMLCWAWIYSRCVFVVMVCAWIWRCNSWLMKYAVRCKTSTCCADQIHCNGDACCALMSVRGIYGTILWWPPTNEQGVRLYWYYVLEL